MFGDLNKLNIQQENQKLVKKPADVGAKVPDEPTPVSPHTEPLPQENRAGTLQQRSNVRTFGRSFERTRVRHSFDIFDDQLMSLKEIVLTRQMLFGKKTLLGDLVQEALDLFISKERNRE